MLTKLRQAALASLPAGLQFEVRRARFSRQIQRGRFTPDDPMDMLEIERGVRAGDWTLDIGANVGKYTLHMARCVGPSGRVLAFEPVTESFALLAANVRAAGLANVSLFNIALSSAAEVLAMTVPSFERSRLANYYQARIAADGEVRVLSLPLDAIPIPGTVRLVKIDAEGHDLQILIGMEALLRRDRPLLMVEGSRGGAIASWLAERGYTIRKTAGSPNIMAAPLERA
jgi:FkbM family methyltransferase